ncbi:hypothetical protein I3760_03G040300 [Carya illinoinensis]|nr:hypothetical protein I3760_03G040300 [Carya illinoinensis]
MTQTPANVQQLMRGDRLMLSSSDDNVMLEQIQGTHSPDGREVDVRSLLRIVEDIIKRTTPSINTIAALGIQPRTKALEDKTYQASFISIPEALALDQISCHLTCKCSGSGGAHANTISIMHMLGNYSWDAKLVLALSAFALNYGEFWLVAQNYTSNQLAKSMAILRQLLEILEHSNILKPNFDAINNLIKVMLDITRCIVEFRELTAKYKTTDIAALSMALEHIPIAVYWTTRSVVACASQIVGLTGLGHAHTVLTTEALELSTLSTLTHKIGNMHSNLATQLAMCNKHIDERKQIEAFQNLKNLFDMTHDDNMRILRELIYPRDDQQPLVHGATKRRVNIDVLRRKNVLLLISDLDMLQEEPTTLERIYKEVSQTPIKQESQYEVVWLPILDPDFPWTETRQKQFENLQATMPWYSVHHPSLIEQAVIKFIKVVWNFRKKPMLVVIDPQGRLANTNALHMLWIWGSMAFPFTSTWEDALWKKETWRLELLVNDIDPTILNWISEGRYICIYGGEDIEWIRKLTTTTHGMAQATGISLGMVYVGKSNPKERVRINTETISVEELGHYWKDMTSVMYFWVRIESMWQSKMQLGINVENDSIMQEIMTLLSFDGSEGGWALLSRGSAEIVRAKGSTFLNCLMQYDVWKEQAQLKGIVPAIRDHLTKLQTPHRCNRIVLPGTAGRTPERVVCSECGRTMEKFIMYQCCNE